MTLIHVKNLIMNSHLNIFKTYTKLNRTFQLENDLTRALAICFQEDTLFFHEVLKEILNSTNYYNQLFEALEGETIVSVDIQKKASSLSDFEHIFAISLSESNMSDFWGQNYNYNYDPICDLAIKINNILLVFEAKRDNVDCTAQLYNQILNIIKANGSHEEFNERNFHKLITPFDLNWSKLMSLAVKVSSFEKSMSNQNRFLSDFIQLVKNHNFRWLPEPSLSALQANNTSSIKRRIESSVEELIKNNININKLNYKDRLGIEFPLPWAQEILFRISENGDLIATIYPGNTKSQGYSLFNSDPKFNTEVEILDKKYTFDKSYHIKFTSFQKYFAGLWFEEDRLHK